jgi:hypothetical protein
LREGGGEIVIGALSLILGIASLIIGAIGLYLTVRIFHKTEHLKETLFQKRVYKKNQDQIRTTLIGVRESVIEDKIIAQQSISAINVSIHQLKELPRLLDKKDKVHSKRLLKLIESRLSSIDINAVLNELDYFIVRLNREETK